MSFRLRFVLDMQYNVHVRTNLTENKFQLNPKLTLGVYSGFTPVLLDLTQSKTINKPRVDTDQKNTPESRRYLCIFGINKGQKLQAVRW